MDRVFRSVRPTSRAIQNRLLSVYNYRSFLICPIFCDENSNSANRRLRDYLCRPFDRLCVLQGDLALIYVLMFTFPGSILNLAALFVNAYIIGLFFVISRFILIPFEFGYLQGTGKKD